MAIDTTYNLDDDVNESFRFILKGKMYEFRQMTTEEIDKFQTIKEEKEIREYLYTFVKPVNPEDPIFSVMAKKMLAKNWKNFINMVKSEMTDENASN